MVIHKSTFFGKTPSPIWVKMAQIMLKDPLKMSYKSWLTRPLKIFHGPKNEFFGPVQSSTGIKGATDGMLPLIPPNYPKIPAPDVLQEHKGISPQSCTETDFEMKTSNFVLFLLISVVSVHFRAIYDETIRCQA